MSAFFDPYSPLQKRYAGRAERLLSGLFFLYDINTECQSF